MKLRTEPYTRIKNGTKTIEMRLYDEKRRQIQIGDEIHFTDQDDTESETIKKKVIGLLIYQNFEDLINDFDDQRAGDRSSAELINLLNTFYSIEDIKKYGVIGIRLI